MSSLSCSGARKYGPSGPLLRSWPSLWPPGPKLLLEQADELGLGIGPSLGIGPGLGDGHLARQAGQFGVGLGPDAGDFEFDSGRRLRTGLFDKGRDRRPDLGHLVSGTFQVGQILWSLKNLCPPPSLTMAGRSGKGAMLATSSRTSVTGRHRVPSADARYVAARSCSRKATTMGAARAW